MSDYSGPHFKAFVKIVDDPPQPSWAQFPPESYWLRAYAGQECDAVVYPGLESVMLDTSMLKPVRPRYQSVALKAVTILARYDPESQP